MNPIPNFNVNSLSVSVYADKVKLAQSAAKQVRDFLQEILKQKSSATVILATGNSQLGFLDALIDLGGVNWSKIILFHLDEYLGIEAEAKGSFRYYLREKVEKKLQPREFYYLEGNTLEPLFECDRYAKLLQAQPIDLGLLGIGENGHLAFNEPRVANFQDSYSVKLVKLEDSTRLAQVKQGYFSHLDAVPQYAFTVTIPLILSVRKLVCLAPGLGKAAIIETMLEGEINSNCPASVLRQHPNAQLFLDSNSASLLQEKIFLSDNC